MQPECSGCGQEQHPSSRCMLLYAPNGTLTGRFCVDCYNEMAARESIPVLSIEEVDATDAESWRRTVQRMAELDAQFKTEVEAERAAFAEAKQRKLRERQEAMERRARTPEQRARTLEQRTVIMQRNPTRHTCPDCASRSWLMTQHSPTCDRQLVARGNHDGGLERPGSAWVLPQGDFHHSRTGELVIRGRYTHHRPRDMSPADVFGEGYDD